MCFSFPPPLLYTAFYVPDHKRQAKSCMTASRECAIQLKSHQEE